MITWVFVGILFYFFFLPLKIRLLWDNYKARFRYGLHEHSPFWRKLDQKIGRGSIVVDFLLSLLAIFLVSFFLALLLDITAETAFSLVLFGAIGLTLVNMHMDKIAVETYEQNCLLCNHKEECMSFLEQNCKIEGLKKRVRSAAHTQRQ